MPAFVLKFPAQKHVGTIVIKNLINLQSAIQSAREDPSESGLHFWVIHSEQFFQWPKWWQLFETYYHLATDTMKFTAEDNLNDIDSNDETYLSKCTKSISYNHSYNETIPM